VLWRLSRLPRTAVFLGALILALAAFFTPGVIGAALVGLLATGAAVLTAYTWNDRTPAERALRLTVFGILVAIAVSKGW
jgi:uncharacterized membrane-anchored protein